MVKCRSLSLYVKFRRHDRDRFVQRAKFQIKFTKLILVAKWTGAAEPVFVDDCVGLVGIIRWELGQTTVDRTTGLAILNSECQSQVTEAG